MIAGEAVHPFMKISQSQYPPQAPSWRSNAVALGARTFRHLSAQRNVPSQPAASLIR
ncbi:MAG: hypothetical protein ABI662_08870 [Dermatophilaceae bacterium]